MLTEEQLGRRVRQARKEAGLKQEELAVQIGVDQPTISRFEGGRDIGSILLTKIAAVTRKDLEFFLRPEASTSVYFYRGKAPVPELDDAARRMLDIVEDYEFLLGLDL